MSTLSAGQWTPGFPVASATLAQQMSIARSFVTQPGSVVTACPVSLYSLTQGLVSHYDLACGQPGYQAMSGRALEDAHNAFVAKFKPAAAQAFGNRLSGIRIAENAVTLYEREGLLGIELPDMVEAGLLTYADAKNFSARMAELTGNRVMESVKNHNVVGSVHSLSALASRILIYFGLFAFNAGQGSAAGENDFIENSLALVGSLSIAAEVVLALGASLVAVLAPNMFQLGSVRAALDMHTATARVAEEMSLYEPAQGAQQGVQEEGPAKG